MRLNILCDRNMPAIHKVLSMCEYALWAMLEYI